MRKWGKWLVASMVLLLVLSGCSSKDSNSAANSASSSPASESTANMAMSDSSDDAMVQNQVPMSTVSSEELATTGNGSSTDLGSGNPTTSSGFVAADSDAVFNKKLIYSANVTMEVEDYGKAQTEIRNLVTLTGGYIVQFSEGVWHDEKGGNFTIKVPASGFSSFLDQMDKFDHNSMEKSINGQDVSEEYVDLESRLKVKLAMEARYLKFVNEAISTSDLVEFVNELERIQTEIEQIRGRMRYIDSNVSFSTIEIRLYQPDNHSIISVNKKETPLFERSKNALIGSLNVLSVVLQGLVIVLSAALPILIIGGVVVSIIWVIRRNKKNKYTDIDK